MVTAWYKLYKCNDMEQYCVWNGMVWNAEECYGMLWNGKEYNRMVWNSTEWSGMVQNGKER